MSTATITLASSARELHVARQQARLRAHAAEVLRIVVWLDPDPAPHDFDGAMLVHVPPHPHGLRLAAGRNAGVAAAIAAGCDRLVLLDADCVPGDALLPRYEQAMRLRADGLHAGPVTYLPEGVVVEVDTDLGPLTAPHAARPSPPDGDLVEATPAQQVLFWSLSFAATADAWSRIGGFDEGYVGYGGEDTDFAMRAASAGVPLVWVGGAHAYHQHHPTSAPPWQHLDDILRNGRRYAERWGTWPMEGWLRAFSEAGAIVEVDGDWHRVDAAPASTRP
ncbi:hypothetical protein GCM10009846_30940 [Agrococcus versicolor]|uniref:Galactosyltransferase C-terminal domain-containing protein n=1 Tax=Agrococcus versicolor TaxID=501482 RepID=A0ABP5MPM0_9MICO